MFWTLATSIALGSGLAAGKLSERCDAYEIAAAAVVEALPSDLSPFFSDNQTALRASACGALVSLSSGRREARDHYFDLSGDGVESLRGPEESERHARGAGSSDGAGLPSAIEREFTSLVSAFRARDADSAIARAGRVLHLATDAALPAHVTAEGAERAAVMSWETDLIPRLKSRLSFEVRVAPERYQRVEDPIEAVMEVMRGTRAAITSGSGSDLAYLAERANAPSAAWSEVDRDRIAPILEGRLEAAALLATDLIGTAWESAGRPPLLRVPIVETPASGPADTGAYAGSRSSSVFHRTSCPHVRRIKPENLIGFDTAESALGAGRKPCRVCEPAGP